MMPKGKDIGGATDDEGACNPIVSLMGLEQWGKMRTMINVALKNSNGYDDTDCYKKAEEKLGIKINCTEPIEVIEEKKEEVDMIVAT